MNVLLGTKVGMTRIFTDEGKFVAVTVVRSQNCPVVQVKTVATDGYTALQLGFGTKKHPNKPEIGHSKSLSSTPHRLKEFRIEASDEIKGLKSFSVSSFSVGDVVRLIGISKGKGFAGVIKKHNFHRGPMSHGSDHHRAPGSIGSMFPQHVMKGKKMPGRMGNDQVTIRNAEVVDILPDQHLILIKGAIPGSRGSLVQISTQL